MNPMLNTQKSRKYKSVIEYTPDMIVHEFIRLNRAWFKCTGNDFYQKEHECKMFLMNWAETGEFNSDYGKRHFIYLEKKFTEYLENYEEVC